MSRRGQLIGLVLGTPFLAYGAWSLLAHSTETHPVEALEWLVGAAVVHDLVVAPVVLATGAGVARLVSRRARRWVAAGLIVSAPIALFAWPFVRGYGRLANNRSILPRDYGRGLVVALAAVWVAAGMALLVARSTRAVTTARSARAARTNR